MVKNPPARKRRKRQGVPSLGRADLLEGSTINPSSILAWRIPGQRSLAGYSPWGLTESDTTEHAAHMSSVDLLC